MKAVDTNVLVRLFVDDSTDQPRRAQARFLVARRDQQPLHVPDIVLVEFVWVLRARYRRPVTEIRDLVGALLSSPDLHFADRALLRGAHAGWCAGRGDFADHVILACAAREGADGVYTFDEALHGLTNVEVP